MASLNKKRRDHYKRRRRIIWISISIIELLVSPVIAVSIDCGLTRFFNGKPSQIVWRYSFFIDSILENIQAQKWWCVLELAYLAILIYMLLDTRPEISQVDEMRITDDILIPVPAGNGQHGKERFLTESEKERLFEVFSFSGSERLKTKGGLVVQMVKKSGREQIYYIKDDIHSLIFGATRSGKTRRVLLETIWLQLMSGISVVTSDVKGELFYYTSDYAASLGYEVVALDLRNPGKSVHYNFLQPILDALEAGDRAKAIDCTWDLVSVLVGQPKGEPIWYNGETAAIAAAILIVALEAPPQYRNCTNVYYFLAYMCESDTYGNTPLNKFLNELDDNHPAKGVFAVANIAALKTRSSFYTSALGTLRLFTNPRVAEMTSRSDFNLKDISRKKTILYMMIPDEKKTMYPLVSILITQLYSQQVELANEHGLRLPVETDFDLDELGNFPTIPILGNMLSAGASRGVRVNMVIQDYQQLESKYKEDFKNIRTNCQAKIYLKSDDSDTLKNITETIGKYTVELSSASTSMQDGKKVSGVNYSSSASLTGRSLLEQAEVKRIRPPYSICMITGEYAGINILPDLSEYRINQLYGLGNEEHNTALILKREAARMERQTGELELWGIWKKYQTPSSDEKKERVSFL